MSTGIAIALGAFACCLISSLIIAIPLQTAGYDSHKSINQDLVQTQCKVTDWITPENTCYESCNCYTSCVPHCTTTTSGGHTTTTCHQTCTQHCQSCPYTCYA